MCELYKKNETSETQSLNFKLLKEGLAILDREGAKSWDS